MSTKQTEHIAKLISEWMGEDPDSVIIRHRLPRTRNGHLVLSPDILTEKPHAHYMDLARKIEAIIKSD